MLDRYSFSEIEDVGGKVIGKVSVTERMGR
jgi:hypothetical protein